MSKKGEKMSKEMKDVLNGANKEAKNLAMTDNSLKNVLKAANMKNKSMIPEEVLAEMEKATDNLRSYNFREKTLQVGDFFPEATLLNAKAEETSFIKALDGKPAIISFYRGSWCPYCNIELAYYNELLGEDENKAVRMFAISPERPDLETETKELNFTVFSDVDNKLAKELNLVFGLPEKIQAIYEKFGIDLDASQGNTEKELPVPATFIVDGEGKVTYVDLDEDYTTRPDAEDVIAEFNKLV